MISPHSTARPSPFAEIKSNPATDQLVAEFFILEECAASCESLAGMISESEKYLSLFRQLSECISACQTYLAATSRESDYTRCLAIYCRTVCAATARLCAEHPSAGADHCRKACEECLRVIKAGQPKAPWN